MGGVPGEWGLQKGGVSLEGGDGDPWRRDHPEIGGLESSGGMGSPWGENPWKGGGSLKGVTWRMRSLQGGIIQKFGSSGGGDHGAPRE